MPPAPLTQLTTTCGDLAAGRKLADFVLHHRLAACVQIDELVESRYRWNDRLATERECRCTFKTSTTMADACAAAILQQHDYDVPELLIMTVHASEAYAAWVDANVGPNAVGET